MTDQRDTTPPKDLLGWLGLTNAPNWARSRWLGGAASVFLALLIGGACLAAFGLVYGVLFGGKEAGFGTGTVIVALLGAPFLVWSTAIKQRTVEFQKEAHITERISKAVEQLGAEKVVDRIGRSVAIKKQDSRGYFEEKTNIQWRGETVPVDDGWELKETGEWRAFSETVPNIEVRIGGLLSLERIAQDSTNYDKGRDHVRVMEILCAYVRENAPASEAPDGAFPTQIDTDPIKTKQEWSPYSWIFAQEEPRSDIQIALFIIGRRTGLQRDIEANFSDPQGKPYQIDLSKTNLRRANLEGLNFANASFVKSKLEGAFCNGADFSGANLTYAQLTGVNGRGLILSNARAASADFSYAHLNDVELSGCHFSLTHFVSTQLERAHIVFPEKETPGTVNRAFFIDADLTLAMIEGDCNQIIFHWENDAMGREIWSCGVGLRRASLGETLNILGHSRPSVPFASEFLMTSFGDASVDLLEGMERPAHWPNWKLPSAGKNTFHDEWRKWLADPDGYVPPPPPAD